MKTDIRVTIAVGLLAVGLIFQGFRHFSTPHALHHEAISDDITPYSVTDTSSHWHPAPHTKQPALRAASPKADPNLALLKKALKNYMSKKGKKTLGKDKKKDGGYAWVWDAKTHRWVWKKKTDKKEVATAKTETPAPTPAPKKVLPQESSNDDALNSGGISGGAAADAGLAGLNGNDAKFLSLDEWKQKLLGYPDFAETSKFIQQYRSNLVTADVFYQIVNLMIEDSREDMNQLGIMAAGMTPSSTSFFILAGVLAKEQLSSPLHDKANYYLNTYSDLNQLSVLGSVLQSSTSVSASLIALQKLNDSVKKNLTTRSSSSKTPSAQATAPKNAMVYQPFTGILQALLQNPADSSLQSQARQTLNSLQSLLKTQSQTTT